MSHLEAGTYITNLQELLAYLDRLSPEDRAIVQNHVAPTEIVFVEPIGTIEERLAQLDEGIVHF